jgi:hypothetical protein
MSEYHCSEEAFRREVNGKSVKEGNCAHNGKEIVLIYKLNKNVAVENFKFNYSRFE